MAETGWPGMKILQFAFDGVNTNSNLPHTYTNHNVLVYGGTHDNETLAGYFGAMEEEDLEYAYKYLNVTKKEDIPAAVIRAAYASTADVAIMQMQDILGLDNSARMNLPSTVGQNWRWRLLPDQFDDAHIEYLKDMAELYGRELDKPEVEEEEPEDDT